MREKTKIRMDERINKLAENKEIFNSYVKAFYEKELFSGPSVYFHKRVIGLVRQNKDYDNLLNTASFIEYIYATLASWGMHRMGPKGAKMKRFNEFRDSVLENKSTLLKLSNFKLHKINETEKEHIKEDLLNVFLNLKVMESNARLVGNSKALHHLLPDLVPPIDRQYTVKFFYGNKILDEGNEGKIFLEIFDMFLLICEKLNLSERDYVNAGEFTTSIPKLIDNAIVGYVSRNIR